jgi:hypothetical protein
MIQKNKQISSWTCMHIWLICVWSMYSPFVFMFESKARKVNFCRTELHHAFICCRFTACGAPKDKFGTFLPVSSRDPQAMSSWFRNVLLALEIRLRSLLQFSKDLSLRPRSRLRHNAWQVPVHKHMHWLCTSHASWNRHGLWWRAKK